MSVLIWCHLPQDKPGTCKDPDMMPDTKTSDDGASHIMPKAEKEHKTGKKTKEKEKENGQQDSTIDTWLTKGKGSNVGKGKGRGRGTTSTQSKQTAPKRKNVKTEDSPNTTKAGSE